MTSQFSESNTNFSFEAQLATARYLWSNKQARSEQLPSESLSWHTFVFLGGRGSGKTRAASEWLVWESIKLANSRWAIIAPTMQDALHTCVEGESGLLPVLNRFGIAFLHLRSHNVVKLQNGSQIFLFSAEEPNRLRGPQFHGAWIDELSSFNNPEAYDLLIPTLRLGEHPQHFISTTPKPTPLIRELVRKESAGRIVVKSSTFDNAKNLPASFIEQIEERFAGTRYARQEIEGELLDDAEGALFKLDTIEKFRYDPSKPSPTCYNRVIAVDPAVTFNEDSAHTGIVVAGIGFDGHIWILEDATMKGPPFDWAKKVVELFRKYQCSSVAVEGNNGGDIVVETIKHVDSGVHTQRVTALKSKENRFNPVSILYEQGMVHHVGVFFELEAQMTSWVPNLSRTSPDRLDALAWAVEILSKSSNSMKWFYERANICSSCEFPNDWRTKNCYKCLATLKYRL
jgi:phage terminase large subunit-like protein